MGCKALRNDGRLVEVHRSPTTVVHISAIGSTPRPFKDMYFLFGDVIGFGAVRILETL